MDQRTVLITGVAGRWGHRLARQLVKFPIVRVLGLDLRAPERPIDGVEYVQADIRDPLLVELLRTEKVEGILHMVFASGHHPDSQKRSTEEAFQINVMGTMEVLAAAHAAGVKQVVLKSTTMLYGADIKNPLYFHEDAPLTGVTTKPLLRHRYEIEQAVADFRRNHELKLAVLRYPGVVGKSGASTFMRYLGQPAPPMLLGFDPLFQVIHEADVVGSMLHAMAQEADGVFNVAADGVMPLSQLIRQVGRQPLPLLHPFAYGLNRVPFLKKSKLMKQFMPFEWEYLRYPWIADTTRMHADLGYTPRYAMEAAVEDFRGTLRLQRYTDVIPRSIKDTGVRSFLDRSSSTD